MKTPLAVLIASIGFSSTVLAAPFSQTYFIGDSLSDSGQFMGARFTTNPGTVWSENLAERLGTSAQPSSQNGSNFAVGGARVGVDTSTTVGSMTVPIPSMKTQWQQLRAQQNGRLDGNALYTVWGGANDLFAVTAGADAQSTISSAIIDHVTLVSGLSQAGARYILVPNVPDLGMTPAFIGNQAAGTQLTTAYNQALYGQLSQTKANIIPLDVASLLHEVAANPQAYGLKNVSMPACGATSSLQCSPQNLVEANADQTYLFADGVHPTTAGHVIMADYAASVLGAASHVTVLAPAANQAGLAQMQHIDRRLHNVSHLQDGKVALWGQGALEAGSGDGLGVELDGTGSAWMVGVDKRSGEWTSGAYVGMDYVDGKTAHESRFEQDRLAVGVYGRWQQNNVWVNAQVYYADLDLDSQRGVTLGSAGRHHRAQADGDQYGGKISAGLNWQHGAVSHGPLLSLSAQKAKIKALNEEGTSSTAMAFGAQEQTSLQSSLGYQVVYQMNPNWQTYASAQWQHEFKDANSNVKASLNSVKGMQFELPAAHDEAKNSAVLELGINGNVNENWTFGAGVMAQVGDAPGAQTAIQLNTSYRF